MKINLTIKEEIPKNSEIPPQTPNKTLSVDDLLSFFDMYINLLYLLAFNKCEVGKRVRLFDVLGRVGDEFGPYGKALHLARDPFVHQ